MNLPKNLHEAIQSMREKTALTEPRAQVKRILNEFDTGYYRSVLPGLGWKRRSYTARLTADEKRKADTFAATLPVKALLKFPEALEKGFELSQASQSSRATYGPRMRSVLALIESEPWYPGNSVLNRRSLDECRPKMRYGYGEWKSLPLMEEKGKPIKYALTKAERSPALEEQLKELKQFAEDPDDPERLFEPLAGSTAASYQYGATLWLGFLLRHSAQDWVASELRLEHLVPNITEEMLEGLSAKEQKALWQKSQRSLKVMVKSYFEFLRDQQKARSPRTRLLRLCTLLIVAKKIYASQIEHRSEYRSIPIIRTILELIETEQKVAKVWEKERSYVASQERKWPEPPDGQTVLEYTQDRLIETLRLECRPRQSTGDFCKGRIIAKSHMTYLFMVDLGLQPPGRQQEPRSYRIALSCPRERPATVPPDGLFWPLPPEWFREKRADGSLADNYLYKVYHHDGQTYEQGVWVRERCQYKTHRYHGRRVSVIENIIFADGKCLYDYFEQYLIGQWYVGNFRQGHRYDWWEPSLRGSYGRWISQGRMELCSEKTPVFSREGKSETWVAGYMFINHKSKRPFTDVQMSDWFARNSHRIMGKRITPHTFRYMWATWAFQMELSDAELQSLAHAMGLTVKTLRDMYERCSPTEKNRPINKAIRKLFPSRFGSAPKPANKDDLLRQVKESLAQLSPEALQDLRCFLGEDSAV